MNKENIVIVINWALAQDVAPIEPAPFLNPSSFSVNSLVSNRVQANQLVLDTVVAELRKEPDLALFNGGVMQVGGSSWLLDLRELAQWLLAQALRHGSETPVDLLQQFIEGQYRSLLEVLLLAGITPEREVKLPEEVALVPFSSLPRSPMSDLFAGNSTTMFAQMKAPSLLPDPTAALVIEHKDGVQILDDFLNPPSSGPSSQALLWEIARCLTLFGPSAPTPIVSWFQIKDWERVPTAGTIAGWGNTIHEIYPGEATPISSEGVQELVSRYLVLDKGVKRKLEVPLERLNLALRRQNNVDTAIELGIALESLLATDRSSDAPVSFVLRLRGALVSALTLAERRKNYKILKDVYALRSEAVHAGVLKSVSADSTLQAGASLCAQLITYIINRGSLPQWDDVILGLDPGAS